MEKYVSHLIAGLWVLGFCILVNAASRLVRPNKSGPKARLAFHSNEGLDSSEKLKPESPWIRVTARYHVLLVISVLFFVASLAFYPVAQVFKEWVLKGQGKLAFLEISIFIGTLTIALAYVWAKGDLNWIKGKEE